MPGGCRRDCVDRWFPSHRTRGATASARCGSRGANAGRRGKGEGASTTGIGLVGEVAPSTTAKSGVGAGAGPRHEPWGGRGATPPVGAPFVGNIAGMFDSRRNRAKTTLTPPTTRAGLDRFLCSYVGTNGP